MAIKWEGAFLNSFPKERNTNEALAVKHSSSSIIFYAHNFSTEICTALIITFFFFWLNKPTYFLVLSHQYRTKCSVVSQERKTNQILPAHNQKKREVPGKWDNWKSKEEIFSRILGKAKQISKSKHYQMFRIVFSLPQSKDKHWPKGNSDLPVCRSQGTWTTFKANTESQPDDFCTALGMWDDRANLQVKGIVTSFLGKPG